VVGISADGERVYVALADARLVALDARTGEERWRIAVPGQLDEPPAIAGERIYIGQRDGRVLAIEAASGRVLWSQAPAEPLFIRATPLVSHGLVWAVTERSLAVFDAESGELLATHGFGAGGNAVGAVALDRHVAFSTGSEQRLHASAHGGETFAYPLDGIDFVATADGLAVAVGGSRVLVVDEDARPHWWERFRRQWSEVSFVGIGPPVPSPPREWLAVGPATPLAPALGDGRVFVAEAGAGIRALALADGAEHWARVDLAVRAAPVLAADGLVVPMPDALLVLDPASGREQARLELPEPPHAVIVTERGTYIASGSGLQPTAVTALTR
jgi:outer membrane protein assembly factor BamB